MSDKQNDVQLIEQTSKKWKKWKLIGVGVLVLCFLLAALMFTVSETFGLILAALGLFGGGGLIIWANTMIWWHHE